MYKKLKTLGASLVLSFALVAGVQGCGVFQSSSVLVEEAQKRPIGTRMPDGTVYAGISPSSLMPMYAMPEDASVTMTFNTARKYAAHHEAHGHRDWRVPTKNELNALFNNRAAIGGFNETGKAPEGWYKSSSEAEYGNSDWDQLFTDGHQGFYRKYFPTSIRLVRG